MTRCLFSSRRATSTFVLLVVMATSPGCSPSEGTVSLNFDHVVGNKPLAFEVFDYESPAGYAYSIATLKYYVSDVQLLRDNEVIHEFDVVHYRDGRDEATRLFKLGTVVNGTFDSIAFTFGLDEVRNVDGGLPNTQTNMNMEWPIPGDVGYHFMKLEGKFKTESETRNFAIHTGATDGNLNHLQVSIPLSGFSVSGNDRAISIVMDINEWLQNPSVYDFVVDGSMIMMNQKAQELIRDNGQTVFEAHPVLAEN